MDSELSYCRRPLEVRGTDVAQGGVPPKWIVKAFEVVEHVGAGRIPSGVVLPVRAFRLERGEEAFHHGVVPDVPGAAHAARDAELTQQALEGFTGVLATAIGVMQQRLDGAAPPDGHNQRVGHQLRRHGRVHGPPNHAPRKEIEHDGDVEPPFARPHAGEVRDPFLIRGRRGELPTEHIGREHVHWPIPGIYGASASPGPGPEVYRQAPFALHPQTFSWI